MKATSLQKFSLSLITCAVLVGCGSSEDDLAPTVSVAAATSVKEGRSVNVTANANDDKGAVTFSWKQVSGPTLTLTGNNSATVSVVAPAVNADSTAVLEVTVTDSANQSTSANVTVTIANNVAPMVSVNSPSVMEKSTAILTANATDQDGTVASYAWAQTSGEPVSFNNTSGSTLSFAAPSVTQSTTLGFQVTVTDDNGDATVVSTNVNITPVLASYTLNGNIGADELRGADVTVTLAGQTFNTQADESGNFSVGLSADDDETNLFSKIVVTSATQSDLSYYAFLPTLTAGIATFSFGDMQSSETRNTASVNAFSTALYALIIEANNGVEPTDLDTFTFAEKNVSPDQLMEMAAVAKLVLQGGAYALPDNTSSLLWLLTNPSAYNDYVTAIEAAEPGVLVNTITAMINDPLINPPVSAEEIPGEYSRTFPAQNGFLSRYSENYTFNEDGTGSLATTVGVRPFNWTSEDGTIAFTVDYSTSFMVLSTEDLKQFGLSDGDIEKFQNERSFQTIQINNESAYTLKRVIKGALVDTYRSSVTSVQMIEPTTLQDGTVITGQRTISDYSNDILLRNLTTLDSEGFLGEDLNGQWIMKRYHDVGTMNTPYVGLFADLLTFNIDGTGTTKAHDEPFTWALTERGELNVAFSDGSRVEYTKTDSLNTDLQVVIRAFDAQGELVAAETDYAFKTTDTSFSTFDLKTTEDRFWLTTINSWQKGVWDNGALTWNNGFNYFGWQFRAGDIGYLMSNSSATEAPPNFTPSFTNAINWSVAPQADGVAIASLNRSTCSDAPEQYCVKRDWQLLKTGEGVLGERIYVMEVQYSRNDSTSEWVPQIGMAPRLNMYENIEFSYWNDNATEKGATVSSQASAGVERIVIEPNRNVVTQQ